MAKWHEAIHGVDDALTATTSQAAFTDFDAPRQVTCYIGSTTSRSGEGRAREFWAEEAGRAAAVSYPHLCRSEAFSALTRLAGRPPSSTAWRFLYQAAEDIGVNISALVTQLQLEGWIVVTEENGKQMVYVQPRFNDLDGGAN